MKRCNKKDKKFGAIPCLTTADWMPRDSYERLYHILYPVDFYFDESGIHAGAPAFVMAGYLASTQAWTAFEQRWKATLNEAGLSQFHMSEFEARVGEFKGWTRPQAIALQVKLLDIINETVTMGICCTMTLRDYEAVIPIETRQAYGVRIPHSLCFMECLNGIQLYMDELKSPEVVGFIFDQNPDFSPMMSTLFFSLKELFGNPSWMSGVRFEDRRKFCQLQAADVLAYEMFKHMFNLAQESPIAMRKSLERLDTVKIMKKRLDQNKIREWTGYALDSITDAINLSPPIDHASRSSLKSQT